MPGSQISAGHEEGSQDPGVRSLGEQVNSLGHFQQFSRLHFIGQWRTRAHDLLKSWFIAHPEWNHGPLAQQLLFAHLDMDAFFCSVALAKPENAHLRDCPVGVAAGKYNSDISSCNYVARSFGIRAGMYVNHARTLCPDLRIVGYDLKACEDVDKILYEIILTRAPPGVSLSMEVYSIDEVMLAFDTPDYAVVESFCERVRQELFEATSCTVSCGIGPNIMVARIATGLAKPNGVRSIHSTEVSSVISELPFKEVHGAGRSTLSKVAVALDQAQVAWRAAPAGVVSQCESRSAHCNADGEKPGQGGDSGSEEGDGAGDHDDHKDESSAERGYDSLLCYHVQRLSRETLQRLLGRTTGENVFNLCRGQDYREVRRTGDDVNQRQLGKIVPSSLGCSMNYAVRPKSAEDVFDILGQLLHDVAKKLLRGDYSCTGSRVTLLERNPLHPKETQKFMGRGYCLEFNLSVSFPGVVSGREEHVMLHAIRAAVEPLLVSRRDETDEQRAKRFGLVELTTTVWTAPIAQAENIVISDLRGFTVQVTGVRASNDAFIQGVAGGGNATTMRKRLRERLTGQMSLAASFQKGMRAAPCGDQGCQSTILPGRLRVNKPGESPRRPHGTKVEAPREDADCVVECLEVDLGSDEVGTAGAAGVVGADATVICTDIADNDSCSNACGEVAVDSHESRVDAEPIVDVTRGLLRLYRPYDTCEQAAETDWGEVVALAVEGGRDYATAKAVMRCAALHFAESLPSADARVEMASLMKQLEKSIAAMEGSALSLDFW